MLRGWKAEVHREATTVDLVVNCDLPNIHENLHEMRVTKNLLFLIFNHRLENQHMHQKQCKFFHLNVVVGGFFVLFVITFIVKYYHTLIFFPTCSCVCAYAFIILKVKVGEKKELKKLDECSPTRCFHCFTASQQMACPTLTEREQKSEAKRVTGRSR